MVKKLLLVQSNARYKNLFKIYSIYDHQSVYAQQSQIQIGSSVEQKSHFFVSVWLRVRKWLNKYNMS